MGERGGASLHALPARLLLHQRLFSSMGAAGRLTVGRLGSGRFRMRPLSRENCGSHAWEPRAVVLVGQVGGADASCKSASCPAPVV